MKEKRLIQNWIQVCLNYIFLSNSKVFIFKEHNENVILHEKMCDLRFERIDVGTQIPGFYLDSTSFWLCDDGQVTPHLCISTFSTIKHEVNYPHLTGFP